MLYRAKLRGFDLARIEEIVRYSSERYVDHATGRLVAVGKYANELILVAYETDQGVIRPITAHVTARTQIEVRIRSGRLGHE